MTEQINDARVRVVRRRVDNLRNAIERAQLDPHCVRRAGLLASALASSAESHGAPRVASAAKRTAEIIAGVAAGRTLDRLTARSLEAMLEDSL